ncbi:MAG: 2OG-Fe(II) oxygenase [Burkholderiales bacterium]|nr:2OG-Fe(II) oxygenase [Burkholderiales bacterium]
MTSAARDDATSYVYMFPSRVAFDGRGGLSLQWPADKGPFAVAPAPAPNGALATVQAKPDALTAEECDRVIALGEAAHAEAGRVEDGPSRYRVSRIAWLAPSPDTEWLFHRLAVLFAEANRHYGLELVGFVDALQYTVYGAGQHFDWHLDLGPGSTSARKLSMSIQLSHPDDYAGGGLEFVSVPLRAEASRRGTAIIFPSFLAHRVTAVTRGIRRSLVGWAYGPTFR